MTVEELFDQIELQGEIKIVYFDEKLGCRVPISREDAAFMTINFMYVENGVMYIEVEQ